MNILKNYLEFTSNLLSLLSSKGVDLNELKIDHLGYQVASADEYDLRVNNLSGQAKMLSENLVGGRRVGIFRLNDELKYDKYSFNVIEIFEPREGQAVESGWEHVEFLPNVTLENFIEEYPDIEWDTSAIDRSEFPMLILKLGEGIRAKFPRLGVEEEIQRLKSN